MSGKQSILEEECKLALRNYLQDDNFKITNIEGDNITTLEGIMGSHFKVNITYKFNNKTSVKRMFIKKMESIYKVQTEMIKLQGAYAKEAFIYEIFFRNLEKIPTLKVDFAAKCYLAKKDEVFIMEDLQELGYEKEKSGTFMLDFNHMKLILQVLAEFHATSIIYEKNESKIRGTEYRLTDDFSQYFQEPLYREDENYLGHKLLKCGENAMLALIDIAPQYASKRHETKEKFSKYVNQMFDLVKSSTEFRNVICHGDIWSSNFLFKYEEEIPVSCKMIDFQALRYTIPASDVTYLLLCNTTELMKKHRNELLLHYYESLRKNLQEHSIDLNDIFNYDKFLKSVNYVLPFSVTQKLIFCTFYVAEFMQEKMQDGEVFKTLWYVNRTDISLEHYRNTPIFRNIVDDALEALDFLE